MKKYKERAEWIPKTKVFIKQIMVSMFSYITLPLFREKKDGIKEFFKKNYYDKPDGLVFDGTSSGYFSRIKYLSDISTLSKGTVVDLGCGQGGFYFWLCENNLQIKRYIGIDFSIKPQALNENCVFICDNILNLKEYLSNETNTVVMSNLLCYIDDDTFIKILNNLRVKDNVIIIDPAPNVFWDAHFDGVKPVYRTLETVCSLLKEQGFIIKNIMSDYIFKIGPYYISELSYGIFAFKEGAPVGI